MGQAQSAGRRASRVAAIALALLAVLILGASQMDRRFSRARYDADQMVAAFAARLKDAVDVDAVQADLAAVVQRALEPAHVRLWTNGHG